MSWTQAFALDIKCKVNQNKSATRLHHYIAEVILLVFTHGLLHQSGAVMRETEKERRVEEEQRQ